MTDTSIEAVERLASHLQSTSNDTPAREWILATIRVLLAEREEAAERIEELEAACEVVSGEFEGELWVVCRRILKKTGFDFHSDDGVQAAVFEEHINEELADLKSRAEAAESRAKELEGANAALRAANDMLLRAIAGDDNG